MKKLSGIIAAAVCVTVGGVYATWTFADSNDIARIQTTITVGLTDIQTSGTAAGTYTFKENSLSIVVDQKDTGDHTAVLDFDGSVTIVFTPNVNAGGDVKESALETIFRIEPNKVLTEWTYNDDSDNEDEAVQIFNVNTANQTINGVVGDETVSTRKWTKMPNGDFEYVMNCDELASLINFANTFVIESKTEHEKFDAALAAGSFILYVNDATTATGNT